MIGKIQERFFLASKYGFKIDKHGDFECLSGADLQGDGEIEVQAVDVRATEPNQRRMSKYVKG